VRLLLAAIKQKEVDERIELDDAAVIAIVEKLLKQRKDSATQYQAAGRHGSGRSGKFRDRRADAYMPQALGAEEVAALIQQAIAETGAASARDMGKVIAWLKPETGRPRRHGRGLRPGQNRAGLKPVTRPAA
jgi:uncharacterized protein